MATPAQITANRLNAALSTGPRTSDGKARVRQNALQHGLCSDFPRMCDEKLEEIHQLIAILREEHQPVDATEEILVNKMAEHFWTAKRASFYLARQMDVVDAGAGGVNVSLLSVMLRYQSTADRAYYKALAELRKLQKERQLREIGFVSQETPATSQPAAEALKSAAELSKPATETPALAVQPDPTTTNTTVAAPPPLKKAA